MKIGVLQLPEKLICRAPQGNFLLHFLSFRGRTTVVLWVNSLYCDRFVVSQRFQIESGLRLWMFSFCLGCKIDFNIKTLNSARQGTTIPPRCWMRPRPSGFYSTVAVFVFIHLFLWHKVICEEDSGKVIQLWTISTLEKGLRGRSSTSDTLFQIISLISKSFSTKESHTK